MTTGLYYHPDMFLHDYYANHGAMEQYRLETVFNSVKDIEGLSVKLSGFSDREMFELVHTKAHVSKIFDESPVTTNQYLRFDEETVMNWQTLKALSLSVGAMKDAVDDVLSGKVMNAFAVAYAGHHATPDTAMGFCFTNQIAIAAKYALSLGLERVAILDIDTHSGNGTILSLMDDPRILFAETYQNGYPGLFMLGRNPTNILRKKCRSEEDFDNAWWMLLQHVKEFNPSIIFVSAGFDAHEDDPLGRMNLNDENYSDVAREILKVCPNVIAMLEGGYNLESTSRCAKLFIEQMVLCNEA